MELRNLTICFALFLIAVSQCSEARHSLRRRSPDDINYDEQQDEGEQNDDGAQNDGDGGDDDEVVNGTILTPPPAPYNVNIEKDVQLDCKVHPREGPVVKWLKDGEQYFIGMSKLRAPNNVHLVPGSSDLIIRDIKPSDSGVYKCELIQEPPVSIEYTVNVLEAPRITRFSASKPSYTEGEDMLLTCDSTGSPQPEIVWSRQQPDGLIVKLTEKDGTFTRNSFYAKNINRDMAGKYLCYAMNSLNQHSQAVINVEIAGKPRVHVHKDIVNSAIGVEAILQCAAHENPAPHIRWYKDGHLIHHSSTQYVISTHETHSNLTVTPSSDADFGTFTCEAENHHGTHSRSIELVESPVIEDLGYEDMKLSWRVHSHQPLTDMEVQLRSLDNDDEWQTLKVPLPSSDPKKHEYEVIYLLADKNLPSGKYEATVRVQNEKSWSKHSDPKIIHIENEAQPIQTASVFRDTGSDAPSVRSTTATILSTFFMYLFVRMF